MILYLLFLLQLVIIYATSRYVMNALLKVLMHVTKNTSVSFYLLALVYLPGTFLHELAHLITSVILFVIPHKMDLVPEIAELELGYHVRMGAVHHEATDPIRGTIIGSAPLLFGLAFFYIVFALSLFPSANTYINALFIYLFFVISSSMFTSKQDLKDAVILLPILLLCIAGVIAFKIPIGTFFTSQIATDLMGQFNIYLLSATIINTVGAFVLRLFY